MMPFQEVCAQHPINPTGTVSLEFGIDLLGDFKAGRTVEGMMVIAVILDAVLRSEVLPLVLILHVGVT